MKSTVKRAVGYQPAQPPVLAAVPLRLFAGTSGWAYPTWKPGFYPPGVPARHFLSHYATKLNSVEVNYTFRTLPSAEVLASWLSATPAGFRFSFKAPQRITHYNRLRDIDQHVNDFVTALAPVADVGKMGVLLFQLPPNFQANAQKATTNTDRLRTLLALPAFHSGQKLAFEFRHQSWFCDEVYDLLRAHDAALCIADGDDLATPEVHTAAGHTCFRLRRDGGYKPRGLAEFAARMCTLAAQGREVYTYFRHQDEPTGALNATALLAKANKRARSR